MRRWIGLCYPLGIWTVLGCGSIGQRALPIPRYSPIAIREVGEPATYRAQNTDKSDKPAPPTPKSFLDVTPTQATTNQSARVSTRIMATVNGTPIFEQEVRDASASTLLRLPPGERASREREVLEQYLQVMIDRELLLQDALAKFSKNQRALDKIRELADKEFEQKLRKERASRKLKSDEELKEMLAKQGTTLEGMKRQNERDFIAQEYLRFRVLAVLDEIGHQDLLRYYQEHAEEFQLTDAVEWQHIFLDQSKYANYEQVRARAAEIVAGLQKGDDFLKYMKYDDGEAKSRNGQGSGRQPGEIRPLEAERLLFRMKDGEVAAPLELPTGIHLVRLVKREYAGQKRPFDEAVQTAIRDKLRSELGQREVQRIKNDLRRRAHIEIAGQ